jgi:hypothetical protein
VLQRAQLVLGQRAPLSRTQPLGRDPGERDARQPHDHQADGLRHAPDLLVSALA